MTADARFVDDCDWHLERLYGFAADLGASILVPSHARYVVDLNRPPDNENLYPGQDDDRAGRYVRQGAAVSGERAARQRRDHASPRSLLAAVSRGAARRGRAPEARPRPRARVEAHSIRSHVPRFFDGRLPDFNFGTSSGASAAPSAEALAARVLEQGGYTAVANGRFKGGYITRHYGVPATGVEAVQLGSRRSPTWKRRVLTRMTKRVRRGLCRYCRRSSKPRSRIVERGPHGCGSAAEQARRPACAACRTDAVHNTASIHGIDAVFRMAFVCSMTSSAPENLTQFLGDIS